MSLAFVANVGDFDGRTRLRGDPDLDEAPRIGALIIAVPTPSP
jgi:hypothetical protein